MMRITRATIRKAEAIYFEMFHDEMFLDPLILEELTTCRTWADFEALQEEMSAGSWDALEAAILQGVK